ncbi:MAG: MFS transporter [Anaerolineales bacterium]|nr:MFS transporter [Anaerolineales bacterium]
MTAFLQATRTLTFSSYLSMFFLGVSSAIIGGAARNIGLTPYEIGLLIAAQNAGFMVAVSLSGVLADRLEKPRILFAGSAILGVALLAFYITPLFWVNLLVMFLIGAGMGTYEGVSDAMLVDLHTDNISRYININHFFVTFGAIVITVYLTLLQNDWRLALVQTAALVLLLAFYFALTRLKARPSGEKYSDRLKFLVRERAVIVFFIVTILVVGVEAASIGILTTYLTDLRGIAQVTSQAGLTVFLLGLAFGRVGIGLVTREDRIYPILVSSFTLALVFFSILYFTNLGDLTLAVVFLAGLSLSALFPMMLSLASLMYPKATGTVLGAIKIAIPLGGILLPFMVSMVTNYSSFQAALLVIPLSLLIGLTLIAASRSYMVTPAVNPEVEPPVNQPG